MKRTLLSLGVALAFFASPAAIAQEDDSGLYREEVLGFEFDPPDERWQLKPDADPARMKVDVQWLLAEPALKARLTIQAEYQGGTTDAEALRDQYASAVEKAEGVSDLENTVVEMGAQEALGVSLRVESEGAVYRLRQFYLVVDGRQFGFQEVILQSEIKKHSKAVAAAWDSFRVIEPVGLSDAERLRMSLVEKCGSEVLLANTWEEASRRARDEGKLVVVAIHLLPGFDIENPWRSGSFMDPDLIALLNERFVTILYFRGLNAPFESQDSYGMGPNSFGTTMLVVTPEGEVVGESLSDLDTFLRKQLSLRPAGEEVVPEYHFDDPLDLVEKRIARGELELAMELLDGHESARAHYLRGEVARRELDVRAWGVALEAAAQAPDAQDFEVELGLANAQHALRTGDFAAARERYGAVLEDRSDSPAVPQALFWLGGLEMQRKDVARATEYWERCYTEQSQSRWAWQSAAALESTAFKAGTWRRMDWPAPEYFSAFRHPDPAPLDAKQFDVAREGAIEFLLEAQLSDGGWICPGEVAKSREDDSIQLTEAISCLAARSLLPYRDREDVRRSVDRALDHVIEKLTSDLEQEYPIQYMDYSPWSRAAQVLLLSECLDQGVGARERIEAALESALRDLRDRQHEGGGWSYFISGSLEGSGNPITQSISFTTAFIVLALAEAEETGVTMPKGLVEDAVGCLERMRNEDGTFVYMLMHQDESTQRATPVQGGAGRGPLCDLALRRHGRGELGDLRDSLATYLEYHGGLVKQAGRALMHAGPYAEGSHWVLFDYATAAEAVLQLPRRERKKYQMLILDDLLATRRADGSFLDNQLVGRHYGTAMALLALEHLKMGRP